MVGGVQESVLVKDLRCRAPRTASSILAGSDSLATQWVWTVARSVCGALLSDRQIALENGNSDMVNWVSDYVFDSNNLYHINYYKKSRKIRVIFCQKSNQNQNMRKKDDFGLTFCQYVPYKILSRDLNSFNIQRTPGRPSSTFGLQRLWSSSVRPQFLTFI